MSRRYQWSGLFSIEVPGAWTVDQDPGLISLYQEHGGVGAIQFSVAQRERPMPVSAKQALAVVEKNAARDDLEVLRQGVATNPNGILVADLAGLDRRADRYVRLAHFVAETMVVAMTYNCGVADRGEEDAVVDEMIRSFSWV